MTGSDEGTLDNPEVARLVGPGGIYARYKVIFHGDNAGPHQGKIFLGLVKSYCCEKGWYLEPQMPHMNNLDLVVARERKGEKLLTKDEICDTALQIRNGFPSCKISSGYIQAYRIAQKVIDCNGCNTFLKGSKIQCGVRRDFTATAIGF